MERFSACLRSFRLTYAAILVAAILGAPRAGEGQTCPAEWSNLFPGDGRFDGPVNAMVLHDGELYFAGEFVASMRKVNHIARWNGQRWAGVGKGLYIDEDHRCYAYALVAFDDQSGTRLYAGSVDGVFREPNNPDDRNEPWSRVGITDGAVYALATYQGLLYAAGDFTCIRTVDPNDANAPCDPNDPNQVTYHIARWDGAAWEDAGGGLVADPNDLLSPAKVSVLTVFDDGAGEALFVGGTFLHAGGLTVNRIARWRDGTWSARSGASRMAGTVGPRPRGYCSDTVIGRPRMTAARIMRWACAVTVA
jgi:hypothetical protein